MKKGVSLVILIVSVIVILVLSSAVILNSRKVPSTVDLAVFLSDIGNMQDLVDMTTMNNMVKATNEGAKTTEEIRKAQWVGVIKNYNVEEGFKSTHTVNGKNVAVLDGQSLSQQLSLGASEVEKYGVDENGTVYIIEGLLINGVTYYNKDTTTGTPTNPSEPSGGGSQGGGENTGDGTGGGSLTPDSVYNVSKKVNAPVLGLGMTAVYWDDEGKEVLGTDLGFEYDKWYDYYGMSEESEIGTDHKSSKWANAKADDGSYFVWIPRYGYSIKSGYHVTTIGEIDIEFLKGTTNQSVKDRIQWDNESEEGNWNIHPAFNYENEDGMITQLAGIWVAKYEMSMETFGEIAETSSTNGNLSISTAVKAVSKPGGLTWRYIGIGTMFNNGLNYDTNNLNNDKLDSHLMKNTEWGAVAYLAHSKYGRNGVEVTKCSNYYSGGTKDGTALSNTNQTTTGNEYGIYGMSGGPFELVAGGLNIKDSLGVDKKKYYDNYTAYSKDIYGDAIYETSSGTGNGVSWHTDRGLWPNSTDKFLARGERASDSSKAGIFAFNRATGVHSSEGLSWRIALWTEL